MRATGIGLPTFHLLCWMIADIQTEYIPHIEHNTSSTDNSLHGHSLRLCSALSVFRSSSGLARLSIDAMTDELGSQILGRIPEMVFLLAAGSAIFLHRD